MNEDKQQEIERLRKQVKRLKEMHNMKSMLDEFEASNKKKRHNVFRDMTNEEVEALLETVE